MNLHLDKEGEIWHVEFTSDPEVGFALDCGQREAAADKQQATEAKVQVENAGANAGVKPVLNRPIALNPDGKLPVQEVEKTFLQKFVSSPRTRAHVPRTDNRFQGTGGCCSEAWCWFWAQAGASKQFTIM